MSKESEVRVFNNCAGGITLEVEDFYRAGFPPSKRASTWKISEFTKKTRKRLLCAMRKHQWSIHTYQCSLFLPEMSEPCSGRDALDAITRWLRSNCPESCGFYVLEFKENTPHYHFLIDFGGPVEEPELIMKALTEVWDRHCRQEQKSLNRVLAHVDSLEAFCCYLCKYEQKEVPEYVKKMPRFWGSFGLLRNEPASLISCDRKKSRKVREIIVSMLAGNRARYGYIESLKSARKLTIFLNERDTVLFEMLNKVEDGPNIETQYVDGTECYLVDERWY